MTDVHTPKQRSYNISRIRSKDTKPELLLRRRLWACGFRYRVKSKLLGRPDLVFSAKKIAIFVDGCFWHKCPDHFQMPRQNKPKWAAKIEANVARDLYVTSKLQQEGWNVMRFWSHEIENNLDYVVKKISNAVAGASS